MPSVHAGLTAHLFRRNNVGAAPMKSRGGFGFGHPQHPGAPGHGGGWQGPPGSNAGIGALQRAISDLAQHTGQYSTDNPDVPVGQANSSVNQTHYTPTNDGSTPDGAGLEATTSPTAADVVTNAAAQPLPGPSGHVAPAPAPIVPAPAPSKIAVLQAGMANLKWWQWALLALGLTLAAVFGYNKVEHPHGHRAH